MIMQKSTVQRVARPMLAMDTVETQLVDTSPAARDLVENPPVEIPPPSQPPKKFAQMMGKETSPTLEFESPAIPPVDVPPVVPPPKELPEDVLAPSDTHLGGGDGSGEKGGKQDEEKDENPDLFHAEGMVSRSEQLEAKAELERERKRKLNDKEVDPEEPETSTNTKKRKAKAAAKPKAKSKALAKAKGKGAKADAGAKAKAVPKAKVKSTGSKKRKGAVQDDDDEDGDDKRDNHVSDEAPPGQVGDGETGGQAPGAEAEEEGSSAVGGKVTFARRYQPSKGVPMQRYIAIRDTFQKHVKERVTSVSALEARSRFCL